MAEHKFFPLLRYDDQWVPYRSGEPENKKKKLRPIRYGARGDTYIFKYYRRELSKLYEARLDCLGIAQCPIAYRKIQRDSGIGGKCNIDFAKDAFDQIDSFGDCVAIALDIESYFENLDHARIKRVWSDLLGVERLPPDHFAVFKNITRYRFVDRQAVLHRLGYVGSEGLLLQLKEVPIQLCSPADFRAKICGKDSNFTSLIRKNTLSRGVPQGTPISDLIANFYLLDFDLQMHRYAENLGGCYMRYSDDILLVLPGGRELVDDAVLFASNQIQNYGENLKIKSSKTCAVQFQLQGGKLRYQHIKQRSDEGNKNGFEYLGFRYDGRRVYVRDSTMSSFYRKVSAAAKVEGWRHALERDSKDITYLSDTFNYSQFSQQFSRVKGFNPNGEFRERTFYSYLKRATDTFGSRGDRILRQAKGFKKFMHDRVEEAIIRAVSCRKP
ncbi:MAG: reverse transcriptase domain-containing protein [Gammaproteobacteria bacterium]|nr:reverse transcriptase domain-containing protein [Gammaproteobacteria bacterium]